MSRAARARAAHMRTTAHGRPQTRRAATTGERSSPLHRCPRRRQRERVAHSEYHDPCTPTNLICTGNPHKPNSKQNTYKLAPLYAGRQVPASVQCSHSRRVSEGVFAYFLHKQKVGGGLGAKPPLRDMGFGVYPHYKGEWGQRPHQGEQGLCPPLGRFQSPAK